jgi:hypothetical protein
MKHNKQPINESIQYKGFFINREGCKYKISGNIFTYPTIEAAKNFIDMLDESQKKIGKVNHQPIVYETSNRSNIS